MPARPPLRPSSRPTSFSGFWTAWNGRFPWLALGLLAGLSGLATSFVAASFLNLRLTPVTAVGELIIRLTPGNLIETGVQSVGTNDKPLLKLGIWIFLVLASAAIGLAVRRHAWAGYLGFGLLAAVGLIAYATTPGGGIGGGVVSIVVGLITWVSVSGLLAERLRRIDLLDGARAGRGVTDAARRTVLLTGAAVLAGTAVAGVVSRVAGRGRREVEQARRLLDLPVTQPVVPAAAQLDVAGLSSWMTPVPRFYKIGTALVPPNIAPADWSLRIHGMVENEITLSYDDLVNRPIFEQWLTLDCVSNEVGGNLVSNAWFSGVRLDALLAEAKPLAGANAVLQTSDDGWTCGTPLEAMTDDRGAMLAVAMNGAPLTVDHGFPVRTVVPGLYGYVSATKWVRDMEVTQFSQFQAFWTQRGWGEKGPVKMASRVEVPRSGDAVSAGAVVVAGTAWDQSSGISAVEIALDGGAWQSVTLADEVSDKCWVQWSTSLADVGAGVHTVKVRATNKDGQIQTGVVRDVLPDGATGWDEIQFQAT